MIQSFYLTKTGEFQKELSRDALRQALQEEGSVLWVDFESATDEENKLLTDLFNFHPLAVEDCINFSHHPKVDNYETYLFLILHAVNFERQKDAELSTLELNVFISPNYVVTYHKRPIRSIMMTREKCLQKPQDVLQRGPDFLVHKMVDALVDNYLPTLVQLDHEIDIVEDNVFENSSDGVLNTILTLKKDVMYLKKIIGPQRNTIYKLAHGHFPFIGKESQRYFSDIYDELYRISDQVESFRDLLSGIVDTYLSMTSLRSNQVMKILTVVTTIIMPLTLITGVYGMNFDNMPELRHPYAYHMTLLGMLLLAVTMIYFMKKKNWL